MKSGKNFQGKCTYKSDAVKKIPRFHFSILWLLELRRYLQISLKTP